MSTRRACLALLLASACAEDEGPQPPDCPEVDAMATVNVAGIFDYHSYIFHLHGTITFAQEGQLVTVVETTYAGAPDRELTGEADLMGNQLDIVLVPINGDTDYTADVSFVFSPDGGMFCLLGFSDTNDDVGGLGSYDGTRR